MEQIIHLLIQIISIVHIKQFKINLFDESKTIFEKNCQLFSNLLTISCIRCTLPVCQKL